MGFARAAVLCVKGRGYVKSANKGGYGGELRVLKNQCYVQFSDSLVICSPRKGISENIQHIRHRISGSKHDICLGLELNTASPKDALQTS